MRWLTPIPVVVAMVLGVWITGGLITNDYKSAMLLTAVWMALFGLACLFVAASDRRLRVPVLGAYVVAAGALGAYLGLTTLTDKVVEEQVATATAEPAKARPQADGAHHRHRNVLLATAGFESGEHESHGTARTIRLAQGGRVLTLTDFSTSPGPDLRVYLVAGPAADESQVDDYVDLGGLKGNKGDQQYTVPAEVDLRKYETVVIWCRAFSVLFARAPLESA
jgi:Electron transfer DM13